MSSAGFLFNEIDLSGQPRSFWEAPVSGGSTRAHVAAVMDVLPQDFSQWDIQDQNGVTVAHLLVAADLLPQGFEHWSIRNKSGATVAHTAVQKGRMPSDLTLEVLSLKDREGQTVAHLALEHDAIPSGFEHWGISNEQGETLASRLEQDPAHAPKSAAVYQAWRIQNVMGAQAAVPSFIQRNIL